MTREQKRNLERHIDALYDTIHDEQDSGQVLTALGAVSGIETTLEALGYRVVEVYGYHTIEEAEDQLPDTYAEIDYGDREDAEAYEGARWDDMNYLRYTER